MCSTLSSETFDAIYKLTMWRFCFFLFIVAVSGKDSPQNLNNREQESAQTKGKDGFEHHPTGKRYKPDWDDLDSRPLPRWYDEAKIGIFLHWGVYSVPSFVSEWFWIYWNDPDPKKHTELKAFMKKNYPPGFTYQDFGPQFTAEFFDPDQWASLFAKSGAKYVVLTSKHHEGFTLFPSKRSFGWNSVDIGPKRDLVGALAKSVRRHNMKFGAYHSLFEWFNPIYLEDEATNFTTRTFTETKLWPDIKQLVNDYNISVLWSDGDWEALDDYWKSTELLAWLYNDSPVKDDIVVNDRWGKGTAGKHGDFYNHEDSYNPHKLLQHKWENAFKLDKVSWGYRRTININDVISIYGLVEQVVSTVSCGGNVLMDIGPTKEGTIIPIYQERLLQLGAWLKIYGEAIYGTSPWLHQEDSIGNKSGIWYTCVKARYDAMHPTAMPAKGDDVTAIYAISVQLHLGKVLKLKDIAALLKSGGYKVELMCDPGNYLEWKVNDDGIAEISLPEKKVLFPAFKFSKK